MFHRVVSARRVGQVVGLQNYFTSFSTRASTKPLDGVLVVALEQAVAAPLCTARLADDGARVIKIERSTGDFARYYDKYANGQSSYFTWINRGKESLVLDVKDPSDKCLLDSILSKADVFVQNLAPGSAERMGLGCDALRNRYPSLVTVDISGYGTSGRKRDYKAYDLLVAAEAGLCSITGSPDAPGRPGVSVTDILTGLNAYGAVLKALRARDQCPSHAGSSHHVSLFDSVAEVMNVPYLQTVATGSSPQRLGLRHPSIAPYGDYRCRDGRSILISVQNDAEWQQLCRRVLGKESLIDDARFCSPSRRVEYRQELDAIVQEVFMEHSADEMEAKLLDASIAFGALNSVQDLVSHPQLRTSQYETESGDVTVIANPVQSVWGSGDGEIKEKQRVPGLGEHSQKLRKEFGDSGD